MEKIERTGELEINQNLDFQRRTWVAQRVGWTVIALVVLAALLGLFGVGLLSNGAVGNPEAPLSVKEYERFLRFMKPTTLEVRLDPGPGAGREARVWLSQEYLEGVQIQQINPQPERVETGPDGLVYVFELNDPDRPAVVIFNLQPQKIGLVKGRIRLDGGEQLSFEQFVYP